MVVQPHQKYWEIFPAQVQEGRRESRDAAVQKLCMWLQKLVELCMGGQTRPYSFYSAQSLGENRVGSLAAVAEVY